MKICNIKWVFLTLLFLFCSCSENDTLEEQTTNKIKQLQETSQLSTVEYTVHKIIKAEDSTWYKIGDRKILFSCTAYIKAGVDLENFSIENVKIDNKRKSIIITVPHAEIQSINIPNEKLQLVYQKVGIFRSNFSEKEKESLIKQGEEDIRKDIPNMGILEQADKNTKDILVATFKTIGLSDSYRKFLHKK